VLIVFENQDRHYLRISSKCLGDGLYADFDDWQVELFASNGIEKTAVVYLEPELLDASMRYVEELRNTARDAQP